MLIRRIIHLRIKFQLFFSFDVGDQSRLLLTVSLQRLSSLPLSSLRSEQMDFAATFPIREETKSRILISARKFLLFKFKLMEELELGDQLGKLDGQT